MKTNLLSPGNSNAKTVKNSLTSYILYLAPYNLSGSNVCPNASPGCIAACLFESGMAVAFPKINEARLAKTMRMKEDVKGFYSQLGAELVGLNFEAGCKGEKYAIRLNGTDDMDHYARLLSRVGLDVSTLSNLIFYGYTKIKSKLEKYSNVSNVYQIFSRSEINESDTLEMLGKGFSASVVFRKKLPETWNGYKVIDGDLSDLEMLEYKNQPVILGLVAKGPKAKKDKSGFVVD